MLVVIDTSNFLIPKREKFVLTAQYTLIYSRRSLSLLCIRLSPSIFSTPRRLLNRRFLFTCLALPTFHSAALYTRRLSTLVSLSDVFSAEPSIHSSLSPGVFSLKPSVHSSLTPGVFSAFVSLSWRHCSLGHSLHSSVKRLFTHLSLPVKLKVASSLSVSPSLFLICWCKHYFSQLEFHLVEI